MSKFTKAPEDLEDLVLTVSAELDMERLGIDFETMCVEKAKEVVEVKKASAVAEYLSERDDLFLVIIYKKAFDKVDDNTRHMWIRLALEQINYDTEKDKLSIGVPSITMPVGIAENTALRDKSVDALLLARYTISQIEDEEQQRKANEKAAKLAKKNKQTNN